MTADTPGSRRVLVLNGPNLNLLGTREPEVYGTATLADVEKLATEAATSHGWSAECVQSNHEGALIDTVHAARDTADAIIINPGGYSHTSVALRDALSGVALPVVEVHITNIHKREQFRHHSYISGVADAVIAGAGIAGYRLAVEYLAEVL
ncbi:type II 3-dehydroquinate dehydratase [Arthrobacter sp.]|uniref:type II 3-dehydroquinate dehydratase n=1 Tax=Arthrobacter sp. TaxID=1667 RepID=UPI00339B01B4